MRPPQWLGLIAGNTKSAKQNLLALAIPGAKSSLFAKSWKICVVAACKSFLYVSPNVDIVMFPAARQSVKLQNLFLSTQAESVAAHFAAVSTATISRPVASAAY